MVVASPIGIDASAAATGTEDAGLMKSEYADAKMIRDLVKPLLTSSPNRSQGVHAEQNVLMRALAGTGKTWSIKQLALHLLHEPQASDETVPLVPLLIPVQRLAVYMRKVCGATQRTPLHGAPSP